MPKEGKAKKSKKSKREVKTHKHHNNKSIINIKVGGNGSGGASGRYIPVGGGTSVIHSGASNGGFSIGDVLNLYNHMDRMRYPHAKDPVYFPPQNELDANGLNKSLLQEQVFGSHKNDEMYFGEVSSKPKVTIYEGDALARPKAYETKSIQVMPKFEDRGMNANPNVEDRGMNANPVVEDAGMMAQPIVQSQGMQTEEILFPSQREQSISFMPQTPIDRSKAAYSIGTAHDVKEHVSYAKQEPEVLSIPKPQHTKKVESEPMDVPIEPMQETIKEVVHESSASEPMETDIEKKKGKSKAKDKKEPLRAVTPEITKLASRRKAVTPMKAATPDMFQPDTVNIKPSENLFKDLPEKPSSRLKSPRKGVPQKAASQDAYQPSKIDVATDPMIKSRIKGGIGFYNIIGGDIGEMQAQVFPTSQQATQRQSRKGTPIKAADPDDYASTSAAIPKGSIEISRTLTPPRMKSRKGTPHKAADPTPYSAQLDEVHKRLEKLQVHSRKGTPKKAPSS